MAHKINETRFLIMLNLLFCDAEECEGDALDEDACNAGPCNEIADATTSAFVCGNTTAAANQLKKKSAVLRIFGGRVCKLCCVSIRAGVSKVRPTSRLPLAKKFYLTRA